MKKTVKLISFLLLAFAGNNNLSAYSGGNGTEQTPYLISSKADMEQLASMTNAGQTYAGIHFLLTRDLTGEADTITTVIASNSSIPFCGIFDGGGYEIAVKSTNGIFGYITDAIIKWV